MLANDILIVNTVQFIQLRIKLFTIYFKGVYLLVLKRFCKAKFY